MEQTETLGARLRRLRLERGLSQRDVSDKGVSYAYVSRVEAEARTPSVKAIRKLAEKLDVTPFYLEHGYEQMAYVLLLPATLLEQDLVMAVLTDEKIAHELREWFIEQGYEHAVLQEIALANTDVIKLLKKKYRKREWLVFDGASKNILSEHPTEAEADEHRRRLIELNPGTEESVQVLGPEKALSAESATFPS